MRKGTDKICWRLKPPNKTAQARESQRLVWSRLVWFFPPADGLFYRGVWYLQDVHALRFREPGRDI
jgi:hypothetical protein